MENIIAIISIVAICAIGLVIVLCLRIEEIQKDKKKILADKQGLEVELKAFKYAYTNLKYKQNKNTYTSYIDGISKDTLEAVKYAMNKAHPDNGGDAEKFMRYKKCYDELRSKK